MNEDEQCEDTQAKMRKLQIENERLLDEKLCKVCMDEQISVSFLPCGHFVCCMGCAPGLRHCPICRQTIKDTVRTYMT